MNYADFVVGSQGPLGRKIKEIILQHDTFIVYIDDADRIEWSTTSSYGQFNASFGSIQNRVSHWESLCDKLFSKSDSFDYKCLLAEAIARILDEKNPELANDILQLTINRIEKHGREILKQDYILACFYATIAICIAILILVLSKIGCTYYIGYGGYQIVLTSLFGGIGAFVFATFRLKEYSPELAISKAIHRIDGIMRVFYGIIAGLIVAVGIRSNIVLGFINQVPLNIYLNLFLGIMAGASEVLIPNLIKQIEHRANANIAPAATTKTSEIKGKRKANSK